MLPHKSALLLLVLLGLVASPVVECSSDDSQLLSLLRRYLSENTDSQAHTEERKLESDHGLETRKRGDIFGVRKQKEEIVKRVEEGNQVEKTRKREEDDLVERVEKRLLEILLNRIEKRSDQVICGAIADICSYFTDSNGCATTRDGECECDDCPTAG